MVSSELWFGAEASFYNGVATQSLRRNDDDSAYLYRTPSSASNRKTYTFSCWYKRANLSGVNQPFFYGGSSGSDFTLFYIDGGSNRLSWYDYDGSTDYGQNLSIVLRDTSAWYHLVFAVDTTQGTDTNRVKIYVNGTLQTSVGADFGLLPQDYDTRINDTKSHWLGRYNVNYIDGYMAEVNFVDGTQLAPTSFGETKNGVWIPKKYTGSYGTNGFRLQFNQTGTGTASSSTIGADTSGNTHHFTSSGIVASDCNMPDSPENNFCTLNPLFKEYATSSFLSEGNLKYTMGTSGVTTSAYGSMAVNQNQGGKWYAEVRIDDYDTGSMWVGVFRNLGLASKGNLNAGVRFSGYAYKTNGNATSTGNTGSSYGASYGTNNVIGIALDLDNDAIYFYKDGTIQNSGTAAFTSITTNSGAYNSSTVGDGNYIFGVDGDGGNSATFNFGQDSTFNGQETAGGNTDANGLGDFHTAVPGGYLAVCSANLTEPTISPNQATQADDHFNTVLYSGNSSTNAITGVGFQPDWTWIKARSDTRTHVLYDSNRGAGKYLSSDNTSVEGTDATAFASFDSDGFSVGTTENYINNSSHTYVSWNWLANGTTPTKTYKVVVVSDSGNKYRFRNSADSATFAQSAVTLDLQELGTYTFDLSDSSVDGHPMKFSTTSNGSHGGGSTYSTGVVYKLDGVTKTESEYVSGFNSATTRQIIITVASSAPVLYYFCHYHSGMGGQVNTNTTHGSTNFDGSILSVSNPNTTAGFSIVLHTGTGSASTIGHGLGVAPDWIITKGRTNTNHWTNLHTALGATAFIDLNQANGSDTATSVWNDTNPTSTVFSVGTNSRINGSSVTYLSYCFAEVEGYSKFGKFIGNGSTDGAFVYLGFRPAWLMLKRTSDTGSWNIADSVRSPENEVDEQVQADLSNAESTIFDFDFLSNGFKARTTDGARNGDGSTYIYMAFAEAPFKYANSR